MVFLPWKFVSVLSQQKATTLSRNLAFTVRPVLQYLPLQPKFQRQGQLLKDRQYLLPRHRYIHLSLPPIRRGSSSCNTNLADWKSVETSESKFRKRTGGSVSISTTRSIQHPCQFLRRGHQFAVPWPVSDFSPICAKPRIKDPTLHECWSAAIRPICCFVWARGFTAFNDRVLSISELQLKVLHRHRYTCTRCSTNHNRQCAFLFGSFGSWACCWNQYHSSQSSSSKYNKPVNPKPATHHNWEPRIHRELSFELRGRQSDFNSRRLSNYHQRCAILALPLSSSPAAVP